MGASPEDIFKQIGRNIAKIRMLEGLTQEQLADRAGVDVRTLIRHEAGKHITIEGLMPYARVLNCSYEVLILANPDYRVIELIQSIPESGRDSVLKVLDSIVASYPQTGLNG